MILMRASPQGIALIQFYEDCRLRAFKPIPTDPWTIGWGHTGDDVVQGMQISQIEADRLLRDVDLPSFERDVNHLTAPIIGAGRTITQAQFDALVSFAYNVGSDIDDDTKAEGLGDSTLLKKFIAGDDEGAADEFLKWNRSAGRVLLGLKRRRYAERLLFLGYDVRMATNVAAQITA